MNRNAGSVTFLFLFAVATGLAAEEPKNQEEWGPVKRVGFVCADQALILVSDGERRVIDEEDMEAILRETAKKWVVYPRFVMTRSGLARFNRIRDRVWKIYKDLYDKQKIRGMSQGSLSPRAYPYWDRIKTDEDFYVDADTLRLGRVVDAEGKPVKGAEAFLLPDEHINGVYLRDGRNRNPLEEHLVYTDVLGKFRIDVWEDDEWVVVVCKKGFLAARLDQFEGTLNLKLKPWAAVKGMVDLKGSGKNGAPKLSDFPVSITSHPIPGIGFNIYETEVEKDGSFEQRFVPPGPITVSRDFEYKDGGSMSFGENAMEINPGEEKNVKFGELSERMRMSLGIKQ